MVPCRIISSFVILCPVAGSCLAQRHNNSLSLNVFSTIFLFENRSHGLITFAGKCHANICNGPSMCMDLSCFSHVRLFVTLWTVARRLLCPWDSPGKNTGLDCHTLIQGIFLIQGSYPYLLWFLHCRQILYHCTIRKPQWAALVYFKTLTTGNGVTPYTFASLKVHQDCSHIKNWNSKGVTSETWLNKMSLVVSPIQQ